MEIRSFRKWVGYVARTCGLFFFVANPVVHSHAFQASQTRTQSVQAVEMQLAATQGKQNKALATLYGAAKKEGRVVIWGPTDPDHINPVIAAFKREFPGIEVVTFEIQPPEYTQRLVAESLAGRLPEADVIELGPREILVLNARGLLQSHPDWGSLFGTSPSNIHADGIGVTLYDLVHIVAVNTNLVKKQDYPKSWDELLDPKWKGKLILEQRLQNVGGLGVPLGEDWLKGFAMGLKNQQPIFVRGGTPAFNQLVGGQASISIGPYIHHVLGARKKGAPADVLPVSPLLVSPRPVGVLAKARHPNAGKLLAGWLSTPTAQQILEKSSSRGAADPDSGTETAKIVKELGVKLIVDNEKIAQRRVELETRMQEWMGIRR